MLWGQLREGDSTSFTPVLVISTLALHTGTGLKQRVAVKLSRGCYILLFVHRCPILSHTATSHFSSRPFRLQDREVQPFEGDCGPRPHEQVNRKQDVISRW